MIRTNIRQGVILITDFSGVPEFVFNTKIYMGEYIIRELLAVLIKANGGYFRISEMEGEVLLFYKYRKYPRYRETTEIIVQMQEAFAEKLSELNECMGINIEMSLRFIVHYGDFSVHNVNKIKKPDGKAVVEIHQMLESGLARRSSFIFFSDSFLEAAEDREYNLSDVKTPLPGVGIIYHQDV